MAAFLMIAVGLSVIAGFCRHARRAEQQFARDRQSDFLRRQVQGLDIHEVHNDR